MEVLTTEKINNLTNFGWDDTIGNIMQYAPEEKAFIVDTNIRMAFRGLIDDENAPSRFTSILALYKALRTKGLRCSKSTFHRRINPNYECNRAAGLPEDLSRSMISSDQLRPFLYPGVGITKWTGYLNHEFYELASMFLPSGFLMMGLEEKVKFHKELWSSPEYREKMSEAHKKRWSSSEYREKRSKSLRERLSSKNEALNKEIAAAIGKLPPPDAVEKMSITQIAKILANQNPKLNAGTIKNRLCKKNPSFNQALYDLIRPYLLCEASNVAPIAPEVVAKTDAEPTNVLKIAAVSCYFNGR
jgi:hypothetical protein